MAIDFKLPKGVSNSTGLGATPGTQKTAQQNVGGFGNINPNMPVAPQLAKQSRSSYQKGLAGQPPQRTAPSPAPMPGAAPPARQAPAPRQTPVVSRALPLEAGRGYNVFAGMDADQISGMNQTMGLSNMTALPSLAKGFEVAPEVTNLVPGEQMSSELMFLMPGEEEEKQEDQTSVEVWGDQNNPNTAQTITLLPNGDIQVESADGTVAVYSPDHPNYGVYSTYLPNAAHIKQQKEKYLSDWGSIEEAYNASPYDEKPIKSNYDSDEAYEEALAAWELEMAAWSEAYDLFVSGEWEDMQTTSQEQYGSAKQGDDVFGDAYDYSQSLTPGIDPAQKQEIFDNLDNQYAQKLQAAMLGLDRQAAMMGTFGSGGHMMSLNTAVAQVLTEMAGQYNEVEMLDVELQKADEQNKINNAMQLGAAIDGSKDHKINIGLKMLNTVIVPYDNYISANMDPKDPNTETLRKFLMTATSQLMADLLGEGKTIEQALYELSEKVRLHFESLGHYPDIMHEYIEDAEDNTGIYLG